MARDADAGASAEEAAGRARVTIRPLTTLDEMHGAAVLFSDLWQSPAGPEISDHLLKALDMAGSYLAGAFEAGPPERLVGASVGFAAVRPPSEERELHSHMTGALPGRLGAGIGFALKLHQRAWALEHEITVVTWTFDPLVRRNSVFNLAKLAASAPAYLRDVYGSLDDVLNRGGESDRLWARWSLCDPAVAAAAGGTRRFVSSESGPRRLEPDGDMRPRHTGVGAGGKFVVAVPPDIEALRESAPDVAHEWRAALRDVLGGTLETGGRLLGVDADGDFVLEAGA